MSKQEDILAGDFDLTDEVAPVAKSADAETLVTRTEDRFSDFDDAAKTHSGDLNAGSVISRNNVSRPP